MRLFSPAKINLFLRVMRKREDGYHDLASLFQTVDFGDFLTFTPSSSDSLTCSDPIIPLNEHNLISKALHLFRKKTALKFGIRIHLEKHIPVQAGLGGGSSNAATTLWALNEMHGRPASEKELALWGSEIGSDIPFFFSHGTAYCTGRGEIVTSQNLNHFRNEPLWIIKPSEGLSTPLIFKHLVLSDCSKEDPERILKSWLEGNPISLNDLEKPAFSILPHLTSLKQNLQKHYLFVSMTGSGTAFTCLGGDKPSDLPSSRLFLAKFLNRYLEDWYYSGFNLASTI